MSQKNGVAYGDRNQRIVGNPVLVVELNPEDFVDGQVGRSTIQDILAELTKSGRDPRSDLRVAKFTDVVNELQDLKEGMIVEGVITNVTKFGAFVDIGVHQDEIIHVSQLADQYV